MKLYIVVVKFARKTQKMAKIGQVAHPLARFFYKSGQQFSLKFQCASGSLARFQRIFLTLREKKCMYIKKFLEKRWPSGQQVIFGKFILGALKGGLNARLPQNFSECK